jgi:hypothetical protein
LHSRFTRGLDAARLPNGVLDDHLAPGLGAGIRPLRLAAPGLASILAAVVVMVVATSVVVAPGGLGGGTPPPSTSLGMAVPVFRATDDIVRDLRDGLGYDCRPGAALPTTGPSARVGEREGARCVTPKSIDGAKAMITPIETGDGRTVEIRIDGSLYGTDVVKSQNQLAGAMGKMTSSSIADPQAAADAAAFVEAAVRRLAPSGDQAKMVFGNVRVVLERSTTGSYLLTIRPV